MSATMATMSTTMTSIQVEDTYKITKQKSEATKTSTMWLGWNSKQTKQKTFLTASKCLKQFNIDT